MVAPRFHSTSHHAEKILIVDDNAHMRTLVREYFVAENFQVVTASDGREALFVARRDKPDLILLDIMMPEMTGYEFIRTNRALLISELAASVIALLLGFLLASTWTRPIRALTRAVHAMARGETQPQIKVRTRDELGELTTAFSQLGADLARADEARRQMTADIAYDLRTPLTIIGGYIESMRDGVLPPSAERYELIHQEVQHLQRLVEDLRTLSLADTGELHIQCQPVSPGALVQDAAYAFQHQAEQKQITLYMQAESALPGIFIDPLRMAQVFGNLLSNALRYTRAGGTIFLSAHAHANTVQLIVADDGAGIAPEVLPHLFDRFYRGDPARQTNTGASGLGLAISKSIVELHHGTIRVESAPGAGTRFILTFPALPQKPSAS